MGVASNDERLQDDTEDNQQVNIHQPGYWTWEGEKAISKAGDLHESTSVPTKQMGRQS